MVDRGRLREALETFPELKQGSSSFRANLHSQNIGQSHYSRDHCF
jgi:hypothetical protein